MDSQTQNNSKQSKFKQWLKQLGWIGFFFFLIKGLAWVAIGALAWWKARGNG